MAYNQRLRPLTLATGRQTVEIENQLVQRALRFFWHPILTGLGENVLRGTCLRSGSQLRSRKGRFGRRRQRQGLFKKHRGVLSDIGRQIVFRVRAAFGQGGLCGLAFFHPCANHVFRNPLPDLPVETTASWVCRLLAERAIRSAAIDRLIETELAGSLHDAERI